MYLYLRYYFKVFFIKYCLSKQRQLPCILQWLCWRPSVYLESFDDAFCEKQSDPILDIRNRPRRTLFSDHVLHLPIFLYVFPHLYHSGGIFLHKLIFVNKDLNFMVLQELVIEGRLIRSVDTINHISIGTLFKQKESQNS